VNKVIIRCDSCDELSQFAEYSLPEWHIELEGVGNLSEKDRNVVAFKLLDNVARFFHFVDEKYSLQGVRIDISIVMREMEQDA
jgi:hypothetical protein